MQSLITTEGTGRMKRQGIVSWNATHTIIVCSPLPLQFVLALKRVELLLGNLLYPLGNFSFSHTEEGFYISNSIKLKSKALFNNCFQCNSASSYGPLSWEQPNYQQQQGTFVGCRSTWFEWQQLRALPEHFPQLSWAHQPRTPFLLQVDSSPVLSSCLCSERRQGNNGAEEQTNLPLPLCWAQLGRLPSPWFVLWLHKQDGWTQREMQWRGCSGGLNTCPALLPNIKTCSQFLLDLWSTKDLKEIWVSLACEAQLIKVHNWHY